MRVKPESRVNEIKLPELLAPAGDMKSFIAAVEGGADAVYIGAKEFNARHFAQNFNMKEISQAVDYAHLRGVKVYLAVNTLIFNHEIDKALELVYKAYSYGIDAVIVQDIGLASKISEILPDVKLHASTQLTIHNFESLNLMRKLGFRRVILARELSLDQIKDIVQKAKNIEIEIFIHGALCVSYSGQCLFSSIIGGRSGNRGRCAQPCRQKYKLVDYLTGKEIYDGSLGEYLLSMKDLCTLELLPEIVKAGVDSLKIEGRMKSPEYVATVTKIYRKYLDFISFGRNYAVKEDDIKDLQLAFNRGFTAGLLGCQKGRELMSYSFPGHRGIEEGRVIAFDNKRKMVKIELKADLRTGDVIKADPGEEGITVTKILVNGKKVTSAAVGEVVEIPTNRVWNEGDTVYKVFDQKLAEKAKALHSGKFFRKVPLYGEFTLVYKEPAKFILWDDDGNKVEVIGKKPAEEAQKVELTPEGVLEQLESMGNTPFYLARAKIEMDNDLFLPLSEINDVRRRAVEKITRLRLEPKNRCSVDEKTLKEKLNNVLIGEYKSDVKYELGLSVFVSSVNLLKYIQHPSVGRIYIPVHEFFEDKIIPSTIERLVDNGKEVFLALPRITLKYELNKIYENIRKIENYGFSGVLIGNYGLIKMFRIIKDFKIHADFSFNVFNKYSIKVLKDLKLDGVTMSPELNAKQIQEVLKGFNLDTEIIVYGRLPLMISRCCPIYGLFWDSLKNKKHCDLCTNRVFALKDKTGATFPLRFYSSECHFEILNSKILCVAGDWEVIKNLGAKYFRVDFTYEDENDVSEIISMYSRLIEEGEKVLADYQDLLERIKLRGFTKGHYFRGVE